MWLLRGLGLLGCTFSSALNFTAGRPVWGTLFALGAAGLIGLGVAEVTKELDDE